jgi:anti-sigma factor RsiW
MNTMDQKTPQSLTEDECHMLVDGHLSESGRMVLEQRLAQDPASQATVDQWRRQRDALRRLHLRVLDEPVPPTLLAAARRSTDSQQVINQWWRWGGMAAGVVLAFGLGWFSNTAWYGEGLPLSSGHTLAKALTPRDFARQASLAHAAYAPEVRHPVEVAAAEQDHLVQWLSKRVGKPLKIPKLGSEGYELVGGRMLPGESGARAQFMFQNAAGTRITLYLGAMNPTSAGAHTRETAFHFATDGPVPSFYWVDQGFGYALTGPVSRDVLMKLAEAVYRQL